MKRQRPGFLKKISLAAAAVMVLTQMTWLAPALAYTIWESRVINDPMGQYVPSLYGDKIVWQDNRNGNWDVYMYDLAAGRETRITDLPSDQANPSVFGDTIVWQDNRDGNWDIFMYNIPEGRESRVTGDPGDQMAPAVYQDTIVWVDYRNWDRYSDIYMYNIATRTETRVTTVFGDRVNPAVFGDNIVWEDSRNGNRDIYVYSIRKGTNSALTSNSSDQRMPAIYDNAVVWQDNRNGNWDIYMYDLSTGAETRLTSDSGDQYSPALFQNKVAWVDNREGSGHIYMSELLPGTERRVSTVSAGKFRPSLYGDKLVWEDWRNGNADIYMAGLDLQPELFSAAVTGNTLILSYSSTFDPSSVPDPGDFTIRVNGQAAAVKTVTVRGAEIILGLVVNVASGDIVTVSYTEGLKPLRNSQGKAVSLGDSLEVTNSTPDSTPPVWSGISTVTAADLSASGVALTWKQAADNMGVASYRIYKNGVYHTTISAGTFLRIEGLTANTTYTFRVEAGDAEGNWSNGGPLVTVTTLPAPAGSQVPAGNTGNTAGTEKPVLDLSGLLDYSPTAGSGGAGAVAEVAATARSREALEALGQAEDAGTVVFSVYREAGSATVGIPFDVVRAMAAKGQWIEVRTAAGACFLSAAEISIAPSLKQLNTKVPGAHLAVTIARAGQPEANEAKAAAAKQGFTLLAGPVVFSVEAAAGERKVVLKDFDIYMRRTINLPRPVKTSGAAVLLGYDGTLSPVPVIFRVINGKPAASLIHKTTGTYAVLEGRKTFTDIGSHWAKNDITALASRLVVSGADANSFKPNNSITRAQFAVLMARALGLEPAENAAAFSDVRAGDWHAGAVGAAVKAGIITGYADGTFRPDKKVTREEVAVMTARAIAAAGMDPAGAGSAAGLPAFKDKNKISTWAAEGVAATVRSSIMQGSRNGNFNPAANATRAETAVTVKKFMEKAGFI